jgi:hypothetical protein
VPPDFTCDLNALYASLMKDDPSRYRAPTTYTDYLGYMRRTDDGGLGSGAVCPFGYNGDGRCVYGPVYVPPTFKTWGRLPTPTPDPILSKPPLPVGGNCDNGSVGRDPAAIRRCAASVDCAANTQQAPTQCSSYYNAPGCEQLGACPFGPHGQCITGSENVCPKFGTTPEDYLRWWRAQIHQGSSPDVHYWEVFKNSATVWGVVMGCLTGGAYGAAVGIGLATSVPLLEVGPAEIGGWLTGCLSTAYGVYEGTNAENVPG